MKREYDNAGLPIMTKSEWHRGMTDEDLIKLEKRAPIILAIKAILVVIGLAIIAL